jgi:hypothetical protein
MKKVRKGPWGGWYWISDKWSVKFNCQTRYFFRYHNGRATQWWHLGRIRLVHVKL